MPGTPPKIAEALSNANDVLGDRFTTTTTDDGKVWFVSRKFADQPSISYFTETPLRGGNLVYFDTHTKKWSEPAPFSPISDEELLVGDVFGYKNRLLLLTYQRSKQFEFRDLYEWRDKEWRKVDHLEADDKTKFACGDHAEVKRVADTSGSVYFVAEHGRGFNVFKFQLSDDGKTGTIRLQREIADAFPMSACGAHLVRAAVSGDHLYAIYGQQGCGFRWEPTRPLKIDLRDGKVDQLVFGDEVDEGRGPCPPWAFSGARASHLVQPSQWFFLGGCRARGLSSTEEDQSIWIMDLEKKTWKRFDDFDLPAGARFVGAFGDGKGTPAKFYAADVNGGVYEIEPKV